jgi:hypothetical protein
VPLRAQFVAHHITLVPVVLTLVRFQAPAAKKEKSDKPKRAPSAYIIFCTEKRTEIKEANPEATFGELGKLLGQAWAGLSDKDKAPFTKVPHLTLPYRA